MSGPKNQCSPSGTNPKRNKNKKRTDVFVYRPGVGRAPFPPRFKTRFYVEGDWKIPSATSGPFVGHVCANYPSYPFYPGGSASFTGLTYLGPSSVAALRPTGWSSLINSSMYANYKVTRSKIYVNISATLSSNNFTASLIPVNTYTSNPSAYIIRTQPFCKTGMFSNSKSNEGCDKDGWLTNTYTPERLTGYTQEEVKADTYQLVGSGPIDPAQEAWYYLTFNTNSLDVTGTEPALLRVRVWYDVEMFNAGAINWVQS